MFVTCYVFICSWIITSIKLFYCWPLYRPKTSNQLTQFVSPSDPNATSLQPSAVTSQPQPYAIRMKPTVADALKAANTAHALGVPAAGAGAGAGDESSVRFGEAGFSSQMSHPLAPARVVNGIGAGGAPEPVLVEASALQPLDAVNRRTGGDALPSAADESRVIASHRAQSGVDNRDRWRTDIPIGAAAVNGTGGSPQQPPAPLVSYTAAGGARHLPIPASPHAPSRVPLASLNPASKYISSSQPPQPPSGDMS